MAYQGRTIEFITIASSSLGTPTIYGTISGSVGVEHVSGSLFGAINDLMKVSVDSPQAGTVVVVPLASVPHPFPSEFDFTYEAIGIGVPGNYKAILSFQNVTNVMAWNVLQTITTSSDYRSAVEVNESISGSLTGATWLFPSMSVGGGTHVDGQVKKVAPFTSTPQIQFKLNVSSFSDEGTREQIFYTVSPSSGTINPQWLGEDFVSASIVLLFESALSGVVDTYFDVRFKPSN